MEKPALIVIDMLNDFLQSWNPDLKKHLIQSINELVAFMRRHGWPIIWVRQEFKANLQDAFLEMKASGTRVTIEGTSGYQIDSELSVGSSDVILVKKCYSAFFNTSLDQLLQNLKPDRLILAGINTHACVRMTAIDAHQRDWKVILAVDCIDSYDREHHAISMRYMRDKIASVMSNEQIEKLFNRHSP